MKRITTYLLGLVLVVCGCSVDDSPVPVDPNPGVGGMTFVVNLPDPNAGPSSYALSDEDESKVTSIYVFAFSKNEVSGKYNLVDYSENSGTIETDPLNPRKKTFRVSFTRLKTGDKYKYVVVANGKAAIEATTPLYGEECDALMEKFTLTGISNWTLAGKDMPMWGESADMTLTTDMKIESLKLLRMVAKINVVVADAMAPKFKMKEILLYNYRNGGYLVPERENLKAGSTTLVEEPTPLGSRINFPTDPVSYTEIEGEKSCTNYIYTFETEQPKTAGDAPDFDKMHALVIGAEFDGNSLSYYRVNFNKTVDNETTFLDLLRNHRYEIKIVEVKGNGYGTPEEAFNSKGLNIGTEIIEWDDSEMGEIVYNGQYTLSVSKGEWSFSYDQITAAAETNKLKVETNFPSGWKVDKNVDENGVAIDWLELSTETGAQDAKVTTSILLKKWTGTGIRTGYIHLTAGNLIFKVKVSQYDFIPVTSLEIVPSYVEMFVDQSTQLQCQITPATATNQSPTWTSSKKAVAVVGMDGTVIAIADGESTITAELDGLTATATVKVLSGYYPEPHIGWAGSNIYYDAALGYLTFDDVSDTSHENYSGVYFAPGSLLAYSFEIIPSIDLYTFPIAGGTQLYENHGAATLEELCNTMFLHDKKNITDWDRGYLTEAYHAKTNIGDVCHHLTSMGWSPPGYWTLPTANEIAQWVHDEEIVTAPAPNITNRYGTNRTSYYTATPINKPSSIMSRNGTEWLSGTYLSSSIQDGYPLISNDNFVYPAVGNTITTIRCVKRKE